MEEKEERIFLVALKLEKGCTSKEWEKVDEQLYENVKHSKKAYAYNTLELHDKSYMVIKVWAEDKKGQKEWLEKALTGYGKPLDITDSV